MIDQTVPTPARTLVDVADGTTVMIGGFGMIRRGHGGVCVLGAFQMTAHGDLANEHTGAPDAIPAVGGTMDLAVGARQTWVMMEHCTKTGEPRIVEHCTCPLTGLACVSRIYTDLAVIDVTPAGLRVVERCQGLSMQALQAVTAAGLRFG
jgi:3-oxoadipate CoA-transferase beta subunit